MAPVRSYTNWNSRTTDEEEQIEPYRKYFFICEGANTETWYFKKLIDIRKELNIHPLIDIRLLEKTEGDRDISFPRRLIEFAENQKENPEIAFDKERDKMIVVFDGDIFEEKVLDYDELVKHPGDAHYGWLECDEVVIEIPPVDAEYLEEGDRIYFGELHIRGIYGKDELGTVEAEESSDIYPVE